MIIDIVVGAVVLISAIISFLRGLIRELLTIIGVVGGFFAALFFGPKLSPLFQDWFGIVEGEEIGKLFDIVPMNIVADVCAYASVFIVVVIILSLISYFSANAVKATGMGPIDRTLGVIFGILRAVVLLGLLYLPFHLLMSEESKAKYFSGSETQPLIEKVSQSLTRFLPSSDDMDEMKERVGRATGGSIKGKLFENDILYNKDAPKNVGSVLKPKEPEEAGYNQEGREELEHIMNEQTNP